MRAALTPLYLLFATAGSMGGMVLDFARVAIYIRWSTDDQSEGTTLETQRDACLDFARSQGFGTIPPERIFIDDGYSGATLDRPQMKRLRELVQAGAIQCVIIFTIDRLSRNIVDAVNLVLREWDGVCHLKCVRQPIDTTTDLGRMIFGMLAMFADFERTQIRARTFGGRVKRASQGRNPGVRLPFGYKQGEAAGEILIDETAAAVVRRIFDLYRSGLGVRTIAHTLNEDGLRGYSGKPFERSTIRQMLANEMYVGKLAFGRTRKNERSKTDKTAPKRIANTEPLASSIRLDLAIIPAELFEQCHQVRVQTAAALKRTSGRALSSEHLLSGLIRCKCGHSMQITVDKRGERKRYQNYYYFYRCTGRTNKGETFCDAGTVAEQVLDETVMAYVRQLNSGTEHRSAMISQHRTAHRQKLQLALSVQETQERRLRDLDAQMVRITLDYRHKEIDAATFKILRSDISKEITESKSFISASAEKIKEHEMALQTDEAALSLLDRVDEWEKLTLAQRKALLFDLLETVVVYRRKGSSNPLSAEIHLRGITEALWNTVSAACFELPPPEIEDV